MENDYDDWDSEAGDSLTDVGFFVIALGACFGFIGLVLMAVGVW